MQTKRNAITNNVEQMFEMLTQTAAIRLKIMIVQLSLWLQWMERTFQQQELSRPISMHTFTLIRIIRSRNLYRCDVIY